LSIPELIIWRFSTQGSVLLFGGVWFFSSGEIAMNSMPLLISPDASRWIVEKLEMAKREQPEYSDLTPTLCFCIDYQNRYEDGQVFEWCPHPFFDIGWYPPDYVATQGFTELEILGRKVFARPDALEALENKQLVLETVEVGYPNPADKKVQLLRAAPLQPSTPTAT
jgi:hypothetical protein